MDDWVFPKLGSKPDSPVHIVFVGAGAVGCFYASRLHRPDHNIYTSLIARSNYKYLVADGVKLETHSFGSYKFKPHAIFPSPDAAAAGPRRSEGSSKGWDFIIVTTKALPDRSDDAALIAPLVSPRSCIALIQNGVGVEQPYRARFPQNPIVSAVTVVSAEQISPGIIRQNRWTRLHLGPYVDAAASPATSFPSSSANGHTSLHRRGTVCTALLSDWWTRLGSIRDVEVSDEVGLQLIRWHKLCINAAMNPSAVLSGGQSNDLMTRDPELREHLVGVMREVWDAVPKMFGRAFPESLARPEVILRSVERTLNVRPSMLVDWEAGRPMELEVILGNPVRFARRKGIELPRMQSLYALLRSAQGVRDGRGRL